MVLNSEIMLCASLSRRESWGRHFKEDYPHCDDLLWLVWVELKEEDGVMKDIKESILQ